jgi:hypothetical protein
MRPSGACLARCPSSRLPDKANLPLKVSAHACVSFISYTMGGHFSEVGILHAHITGR